MPKEELFDEIEINWQVKIDRTEKKIQQLTNYDAATCEQNEINREIKKLQRALQNYKKKLAEQIKRQYHLENFCYQIPFY